MANRATGQAPYGFAWSDGALAMVAHEAAVRRLAFETYLERRSLGAVAKALNAAGHRTRQGATWSDNAVKRLLTCESAVGRYAVDRTTTGPDGQRVERPPSEWRTIPCAPIIDSELWNGVQSILAEGRPADGSRKVAHPFSTLVICTCGRTMHLPTGGAKFVCPACPTKAPVADLEAIFLDDLEAFVSDHGTQLAERIDAADQPAAGKSDGRPQADVSAAPPSIREAWTNAPLATRRRIAASLIDRFVVSPGRVVIHPRFDPSVETVSTTRRIDNPTHQPQSVSAPDSVTYIRLPKPGTACPHTGLSRAKLNSLILPSERNGYRPPVASKKICAEGKDRGIRLIILESLKAYLDRSGT